MPCLHVYSGNMYGGIESMLATLSRNRDVCPGMETWFALCFEGRLSRELAHSGARVDLLGTVRLSRPWTVRNARKRFANLLQRRQPAVAVFHAEWSLAVFGCVAKEAGIPVVLWNHNLFERLTRLHRLARKVVPDLMICSSKATAATAGRFLPNVPTECVCCPVWLPELAFSKQERNDLRRQLATSPDAVVIVQTSRMDAYKGHRLQLEALGRLRDTPGWVCWQVGGAQRPDQAVYVKQLKEQTYRLGIADRVRFVGERSDVMRVLQAADVHCQPNVGPEPFGIAFVEALHARLPVVTTAIGGALEIVNKHCGALVPPNDASALSRELRRLIGDADLRRELGNAGPDRARQLCDPTTQMARLETLLNRIQRCSTDKRLKKTSP
jgi:glycosyltransferase involved in cell wall biosynthesis